MGVAPSQCLLLSLSASTVVGIPRHTNGSAHNGHTCIVGTIKRDVSCHAPM